jgi:hypothetical protein
MAQEPDFVEERGGERLRPSPLKVDFAQPLPAALRRPSDRPARRVGGGAQPVQSVQSAPVTVIKGIVAKEQASTEAKAPRINVGMGGKLASVPQPGALGGQSEVDGRELFAPTVRERIELVAGMKAPPEVMPTM